MIINNKNDDDDDNKIITIRIIITNGQRHMW